ncbi:hypothetical protein BJ508DRAFT_311874 [Ascobolus immersus RN42]|uniref:Uncharacterized protein n=1 Tax=Ascobolus immersus RN42 TaxID=1160509 RepID=A0A3N4HQJ7_ASCIM|nr:hypothetical protein BJ508DRAFT_311874 [Ascobolus immersus RN42]
MSNNDCYICGSSLYDHGSNQCPYPGCSSYTTTNPATGLVCMDCPQHSGSGSYASGSASGQTASHYSTQYGTAQAAAVDFTFDGTAGPGIGYRPATNPTRRRQGTEFVRDEYGNKTGARHREYVHENYINKEAYKSWPKAHLDVTPLTEMPLRISTKIHAQDAGSTFGTAGLAPVAAGDLASESSPLAPIEGADFTRVLAITTLLQVYTRRVRTFLGCDSYFSLAAPTLTLRLSWALATRDREIGEVGKIHPNSADQNHQISFSSFRLWPVQSQDDGGDLIVPIPYGSIPKRQFGTQFKVLQSDRESETPFQETSKVAFRRFDRYYKHINQNNTMRTPEAIDHKLHAPSLSTTSIAPKRPVG